LERKTRRQRKALSTVVAAVFMIIIMAGSLGLTSWTLREQDRVTEEILLKTNEKLSRLNEELKISQVGIANNKFNLTLTNQGGSATVVKAIYFVNETASPKQQYRYDVNYVVDGRAIVQNVGQNLPFTTKNSTSYSIRVVTDSGLAASSEYVSGSLTPLPMSLYVIPPTVTTGENVTILYAITNNSTSSAPSLNLSPKITSSVSCAAGQTCTLTKIKSGPSSVTVYKGATSLVKEVYRVDGPPDTRMTFNASFTGAKAGNYVIEKGTVIVVTLSQNLVTGIATKPDMYLILPGPFGNSGQQGLWGTVVVNPTASPMKVSRVLMTAFTGSHTGATRLLAAGCAETPIVPNVGSEWSCPHDNQIMWRDLSNPETLQPGETKTFLVRVAPTSLPTGEEEPGATVAATVYTDTGVFTNTGYTVGMTQISQPLGNVYLTTTTDTSTSGALSNSNMLGHRNNIQPGSNQTFFVAMADLDTSASTHINAGARLIINVPPGFGNVTVASHANFNNFPTITTRADGITQIIAVRSGNTGDCSNCSEAAVISFTAITPSPTTDTTYLMFAFIDGVTNSSPAFSAGALAEIALQVDGV
jgi:hypothetical protein